MRADVGSLELSENMAGDERAFHLDIAPDARALEPALTRAVTAARLTGCTARGRVGPLVRAGDPAVADPLCRFDSTAAPYRASSGDNRRRSSRAIAFCCRILVVAVLDATAASGSVLDLYAGVGSLLRGARRNWP